MRTFQYKGYRASGSVQRGYIEALTAKDARDKLAAGGVWPEQLQESRAGRAGLGPSDRSIFYRELAALLRAGMPLVPALGMLLETPELQDVFRVIAAVRDEVRDGGGVSVALSQATHQISAFELAAIDVAERTGTLDQVLEKLSDLIDARQQVRERIQRAMSYPLLILVLGGLVGVVMLGVLLPRMEQITGGEMRLPGLTRVMLQVGEFLFPWGLPVLLLVAGLGVWSGMRGLQRKRFRIRCEQILWHLPFRDIYAAILGARFARTLAILLRAGVSVVDGVALACRATGSRWCEELGGRASENIRHGQTLESAVRSMPPLAVGLSGWIAVGEASGELPAMLDHAASRSDRRMEHQLARFLALLEPLLLLLVGGFVLLITLAVLLPVFSLTDAVLQ